MEFFDWVSIPQYFIEFFGSYLNMTAETATDAAALMNKFNIICLIVAGGLYFVGLLFGGFGLYTMAKRAGVKHAWLGFLPLGNTYLAGELAGETKLFGKKVKRLGLYAMLAEVVYIGLNLFLLILSMQLSARPELYSQEETQGVFYWYLNRALIPAQDKWMVTASLAVDIIGSIWWLVMLFLFCTMFVALFRKYFPRNPIIMTVLSAVLPTRGFVLFAVRKNRPVDYMDYIRRQTEEMRRRYGDGQNYGQGGYNQGGQGYGQSSYGSYGGSDAPFSDFNGSSGSAPQSGTGGSSSDAPFGEFGPSNGSDTGTDDSKNQ